MDRANYYYHTYPTNSVNPMTISDGCMVLVLIFMVLFFILTIWSVLDYYGKGFVWYIWDQWVVRSWNNWWDSILMLPPNEDYNHNQKAKTTSTRKGNNIMYGGHGTYNNPTYRNVWVSEFVDQKDESKGRRVIKYAWFTGGEETHEWRWLTLKGAFGWVQKETPPPPPKPSMYISEGAREEANRILAEYNANKIPKSIEKVKETETKLDKAV